MDVFFGWFGLPGSVVLTALLSVFALIRALADPTLVHWSCFAAMLLSSFGDLFLGHLKWLHARFKNCFLIGAGFFMAAHLMYIFCYGMKLFAADGLCVNCGTAAAVGIGLLALILMLWLSLHSGRTGILPVAVTYLFVILADCAVVFTYAWAAGPFSLPAVCAAAGMLSFLLSDLLIGLHLTGDIHRFDFLVWWLYPIGQFLLILGT